LPLLTSTAWWSETQLALRRVFSQDSDFKESMFARQIAVMKGQAWNVVETLKQTDHGPLELTRRTRVCVWDDLVDIPVAIPLRVPSAEMKRRRDLDAKAQEEMDIGAAFDSSSVSRPHDLLNLGSPTTELPNPNRFELSRDQGSADLSRIHEDAVSPASISDPSTMRQGGKERSRYHASQSFTLPSRPSDYNKSRPRSSAEFLNDNNRRSSGSSYQRSSNPIFYDRDDLEGDLGYSAAEGMEGNEKKVIMERLETVQSSNPVFTCC
jgi:phosphatidylinositol 4-kinase type 2